MRVFAPSAPASRSLDRLFAVTIAFGVVATLALLTPGAHGHAVMPAVDLALDTISLVAFGALTALAWFRFRENRVVAAVYHASAFQLLAASYAVAVLISLLHSTSIDGLEEPEGSQMLVFAVARFGAATLFVIGGFRTARRSYGRHPARVLLVPTTLVLTAALVGWLVGAPSSVLQMIEFRDGSALPQSTPFGALVHLTIAALYFVGAYGSRRLWRSERAVIDGWIAVGLVFAGFGELQWTLFPSAHPGQVSTGDLFRLAFAGSLLIGLESAFRRGMRELRIANVELADLRDGEVERAALEERTRLARELHDGLAQDLWLAKLRTAELAAMTDLPEAARRVAQEAAAAVDVGLGEAREAVAALRSSTLTERGFGNVVRRTVEEYGDRYGLRVEFAFDGDIAAPVAARTQAEILRITQEALTNVARHADASVVGVRLAIHDDRLTLRVVDNGCGFDPAAVGSQSFGLTSMRERALLIGGRLRIASRIGDGTRVVLSAPLSRAGASSGGHT